MYVTYYHAFVSALALNEMNAFVFCIISFMNVIILHSTMYYYNFKYRSTRNTTTRTTKIR